MSPTVSYSLFATGLSSVDGSPVPGFLAGGQAIFGLSSDEYAQLPPLRSWIRGQGGTVLDETGTPAPAHTIDDGLLYAVSLGPSEEIRLTGISRVLEPCEECRLPMSQMLVTGVGVLADLEPSQPVVSTAGASWLVTPEFVETLTAEDLTRGLVITEVETPAGARLACWSDRLLASAEPGLEAPRCSHCLRVLDPSDAVPREWVPRFSLGLFVDPPDDRSGWWWHARLGQHLAILSGAVVRRLQGVAGDVSAMPVHLDAADAFLPEEYR